MHLALLVLALSIGAAPQSMNSRYLTGIAAQGASSNAQADVLTSTDLQAALDLEAQKQLVSCAEGSSCMAEIAAALDAEVVITGTLLAVGSDVTLQVAAYDVKNASSAGRRTLRATSVDGFAAPLEATTADLVTKVLTGRDGATRLRVLVLDFDTAAADAMLVSATTPPSEQASRFGWVTAGGLLCAGVGVGGLVIGGVATAQVDAANSVLSAQPPKSVREQEDAARTYDETWPIAVGGLVGGGILTLVGAGVIVFDVVSE